MLKRCRKGLHKYDVALRTCPYCDLDSKRAYRLKNAAKIANWHKDYYNKNSSVFKTAAARQRNRIGQRKRRDTQLRIKFGITIEDYEAKLAAQNYKCAICFKKETAVDSHSKQPKSLAVDHCHLTGKVRGLLCQQCNHGLGKFQDSIVVLMSALQYLRMHETDSKAANGD